MYNKKIMIMNIINAINSKTGMNFQNTFTTFLSVVCSYKKLKFEKVQPANGDYKNDGWIPEKNIFFAMYSPNEPKISQLNSINAKLKADLDGLCNHVYNEGMWGKVINEFYLIVNSHDNDLPADPARILDSTINNIKSKYNASFKAEVLAAKDIKSFLIDCDESLIEKISNNLDIYSLQQDFSVCDIMSFIDDYVEYLATQNVVITETDYHRINIESKIELNKLDDIKEKILALLDASDKIDKYLEFVNAEGFDIFKYNKVKDFIVQKYLELSNKYDGKELYSTMLDELIYDSMDSSRAIILEATVVNVFIKCDIFKKE